jgi:hypothetical protein
MGIKDLGLSRRLFENVNKVLKDFENQLIKVKSLKIKIDYCESDPHCNYFLVKLTFSQNL